jgi:hypothetical protein
MIIRTRPLMLALVLLAVAGAVWAFTASNTVPASRAGIGDNTISGYTVSNVTYTLDNSNPAKIASVAFVLDQPATTVRVKVQASATSYQNCSISGGVNVTCTFATQPNVVDADQLTVIAVQ